MGSGGREHALALCLARSADVIVTPGNAGMALGAQQTRQDRAVTRTDSGSVTCTTVLAEEIDADLYVIGPEAPLVAGLADRLRARGRLVFGPGSDGARLEGSKAWMKHMLELAGVPSAGYATFDSFGPAREYLQARPGPFVIKTDGLAGGKGVLVTDSLPEALADAEAKLAGLTFAGAGQRIVIEDALSGPELSVLAICDGRRAVPLDPAQDFKRVGDGGTGPNTGGMGAYSPVPLAGPEVVEAVMDQAVEPTLAMLVRNDIDYRGVLYAGVMVTPEGPKIIEYNVRFGDPETQVVIPRMTSDLAQLLAEAADGRLRSCPTFSDQSAVTVVMAAAGYPGTPRVGDIIEGVHEAERIEGVTVFHAGVTRDASGHLATAGGRVLDVTGIGRDLEEARRRAYHAAGLISWPGCQYRGDIALEASEQISIEHIERTPIEQGGTQS